MADFTHYRLCLSKTISSGETPVPVNELHTWKLHVETAAGQPVDNAAISIFGDMPQHGHGMPTQPQITESLGNGDYLRCAMAPNAHLT